MGDAPLLKANGPRRASATAWSVAAFNAVQLPAVTLCPPLSNMSPSQLLALPKITVLVSCSTPGPAEPSLSS